MVPIPGDETHVLLATKFGLIYRASAVDDSESPTVFMDLRDRVVGNSQWEEGLLAMAMPEDYATSRRLYVYYSAGPPRRTVLSRLTTTETEALPDSEIVLLEVEQPYADHNGGGMAFGLDGHLYLGLGDGGGSGDPHGHGQNTETLLGSILRLDVSGDEYAIPRDNPFANGGGRPEIYAYGFRNPWRIIFDPVRGDLWAADVGQDAWEEVNRVERGRNYEWNLREGRECYAEPCEGAGGTGPWVAYPHDDGCAVTAGVVYRGEALPDITGRFVYGDFCSGRIWAVNTDGTAGEPELLVETGLSVASFAEGADEEIYLLTFQNIVYRLTRELQPVDNDTETS